MKPAEQSTEADIESLDRLCQRLNGFGAELTLEWLDGALAALIVGRRTLMPGEWLPLLFGDAWDRAIADPADLQQAMDLLMRRWNVLASQLHPERLFDEPDQLHFTPLIDDFDPAQRDALLAEGKLQPEDVVDWPLTGEGWAIGFLDVVTRLADDWQPPADDDAGAELDGCLRCIEALTERDEAKLKADLQVRYRGKQPSRDELIDEACFAVQDLRCLWLEHPLRTEPRRVDKQPGRNDPCPCGSGRKYKKCHGAA